MPPLARVDAVSKQFGPRTVVNSVSLAVDEGEVLGLLGANGAGKTTLIRLLLGMLRPSGGSVSLLGSVPSLSTRRRVGYVPQTLGLYDDLTVGQNWTFTASAFGDGCEPMPGHIADWKDELVSTLPLGVQRRVAFALALSHHPALLVLDEPTSGVGPLSRARLWQEIREAAERGAGVLVTTHNMDEAEQCDRLVVMVSGHVVAAGTAAQIVGTREVVEVHADDPRRAYAALDAEGFELQMHGELLRVDAPATTVVDVLARRGIHATTNPVRANLEEAFMEVDGRAG